MYYYRPRFTHSALLQRQRSRLLNLQIEWSEGALQAISWMISMRIKDILIGCICYKSNHKRKARTPDCKWFSVSQRLLRHTGKLSLNSVWLKKKYYIPCFDDQFSCTKKTLGKEEIRISSYCRNRVYLRRWCFESLYKWLCPSFLPTPMGFQLHINRKKNVSDKGHILHCVRNYI